jgi:SMC interacting uncharacterized protein involved in chromosome segregation
MEVQMEMEQRMKSLEDLVKKQEGQISELNDRIKNIDDELVIIDREMNLSGKNGYPSLFDAKRILIEKGWLKKP